MKDYPYDNNWKIINSSKSFNQDWIHQIITQREINANNNNLKIELKKIAEETKKYLKPDEYRYLDKDYFKKKSLPINLIKKFLYTFPINSFLFINLGKKSFSKEKILFGIKRKTFFLKK